MANETSGTEDEKMDLSFLEDVTPTETKMVPTARGRQPGKNPMTKHVKASYEGRKTLQLPVPGAAAKDVERRLRRAAMNLGCSISVQVKTAKDGGPETVVPLKDVPKLDPKADVYVAFLAKDKPEGEEDAKATGSESPATSATADPFQAPAGDAKATGQKANDHDAKATVKNGAVSAKGSKISA
jgi:hypothetical protein